MSGSILIIKLGALGDFFQAAGPFQAIRAAHAESRIVLLTTAPFAEFAEGAPWFDEVWVDERPAPHQLGAWLGLRRRLRRAGFQRVYDLQTSDRSGWYYRLLGPGARPEWSGIAPGCSHPHANPDRDSMHTIERQAEQLRVAGIDALPEPDFAWVEADVARFELGPRFALVVPGGAPHRPGKRWGAGNFAHLARRLAEAGVQPVLIGTEPERGILDEILVAEPEARDLSGLTGLADIVALARQAAAAVGNDTGPMHPIAMAGCPSVVLFSHESDPALCAPRGPSVTILRSDPLAALGVGEVLAALQTAVR